ncbi:HNH endonuclease [Aggregatibacter actinomycetemcomitans]|uniref:HNH endonuclease n=1 Tax=Aggregatibacter actinomycetemcomitans TaxID=714 RepID=UPI00215183AE|nr:HNH endonuclease [Aggregatibacter actinomycetemcomitans]
MLAKFDLSQMDLQQYFYYDETSPTSLRWKINKGRKSIGDVAGSKSGTGYYKIKLNQITILCHRVVYHLLNPESDISNLTIDHINGNICDNKISNLRAVSRSVNQQNRKLNNNKILPSGIRFRKNRNAYQVYWLLNGKQKSKYFSLSKFGEDALKLAMMARNEFIRMANNNGASFTDRHGVDNGTS